MGGQESDSHGKPDRCLPRLVRLALALGAVALAAASSSQAATPFNKNLLKNPGAERGAMAHGEKAAFPVPGWETTGSFTQHSYQGCDSEEWDPVLGSEKCRWFTLFVPMRIRGQEALFIGGPGLFDTSATQTVDVADARDLIDGGSVTATLAANIGSAGNERDAASVQATLLDESGAELASVTLGPLSSRGLRQARAFPRRTKTFPVPAGTRAIQVELIADSRVSYYLSYNDAAFDNVVLKLNAWTAEMAIAVVQEIIARNGTCAPGWTLTGYRAEPAGAAWQVLVSLENPDYGTIAIHFEVYDEDSVVPLDNLATRVLSGDCSLPWERPEPFPQRPANLDPGGGQPTGPGLQRRL